ncbi:MAG: DNA cytosine methyltransferase [Myxococcales bacterium]|nr:DNA cytosine methyltransferase [Myxococcales bacterium]
MNYLNEWSPYHAQWCRNLAEAGEIPACVVDETDIRKVAGDRLNEYQQCHFFAGIAGWPLALKMAGVPDDVSVWTGSCPCQPFSNAGRNGEFQDTRHLWPEFFRLISRYRPEFVLGEQVYSRSGMAWLDLVAGDFEAIGYSIGAIVVPASVAGAAHKRDRIWWAAADTNGIRQPQSWFDWKDPSDNPSRCFGEADRFVDAVRRNALPYLCGGHDGLPEFVASSRTKSEMIHGYGNAIVPQLAAMFVRAFFDSVRAWMESEGK